MGQSENLTGLFLGAGASYEAGMPLVSDMTDRLKEWLTCDKLRSLNDGWNSHGLGFLDTTIDDFETVLSRPDLNYEDLLGHLETQFRRHSSTSQDFHGLYSWLVDIVYHLLYYLHVNNVDLIKRSLSYYEGLSALADQNRPLWIFSANHDVIIECVAIRCGIPLNSGFTSEEVSFPRRDQSGKVIGRLSAEVLPGNHLESLAMPFFQNGTRGINLLKIHGALDVFTFRDGNDLSKIRPLGGNVEGILNALKSANEDLRSPHPLRATNEIVYADDAGELQFLRRSLLTGAFKFDSRNSQVLPQSLLRHFESYINSLRTLVCIGYGFGDTHINSVVRKWLEFSRDRRIYIVDPHLESIPPMLRHLAPQVELHSLKATDYLDRFAGIVRSSHEATEKEFSFWIRDNSSSCESELRMFAREWQIKKSIEWIKSLPLRDGNIDTESVGITMEDLIQESKCQIVTPEELMREFLETSTT